MGTGNDSFIDDEDDTCPLCIEEFDLSDRNFKPCPCGYQVCQFCFNNIKTNMNGLCPACRRPYDEKTIEWKVVTAEEVAEFKANIQKNQKKRAQEQRMKEAQQRQVEKNDRKNLVGVRVIQKNLVYVTGLQPTVREDELMKTLRKPEFFGQYGNIQKISISNRKGSDGHCQSLGIYVTFEKKEDASRCIQAVNGSQNGDRILRAQLGTTKYCSAWLRHEQCTNRQCMFLHEQGDEEDSYTRQDLSSMNSIDSQQRKQTAAGTSRSSSRQQHHPGQALAPAASQPAARPSSKESSENGDGSALPSSANWARNPQRSRRGSHATSGPADSPAISTSLPATAESALETVEANSFKEPISQKKANSALVQPSSEPVPCKKPPKPPVDPVIAELLRNIKAFRLATFSDVEMAKYPPMFDINGGAKRRAMREAEKAESDPEEPADAQEASEEEPETGGSLALGGEPEDRDPVRGFEHRRAPGAQPPIQKSVIGEGIYGGPSVGSFGPGGSSSVGTIGAGARTTTPQQQQLYGSVRPGGGAGAFDHVPPGISTQSPLFQQSHQRGSSRFSFANEGGNSSTNVKISGNPRAMTQQASMMPQMHSHNTTQYYGTSMPGPPPGLKSTGTPPSQFHSFVSGTGLGSAKDNDILQHVMRRGGAGGNAHEKREFVSSPFSNQYPPSTSSTPAPASGLLATLYGPATGAFQDFGHKQKKKGKKHRHANTSSSGGSGIVEVVDPSILRAGMQHQPQSNAGVGQGPFGGQSQDDELPALDDAITSSVEALFSDELEFPKPIAPVNIPTSRMTGRAIPPGLSPRVPAGLPSTSFFQGPVVPKAAPSAPKAKPPGATKPVKVSRVPSKGAPEYAGGRGILNEDEFPALDPAVKPAFPVTKVFTAPTITMPSKHISQGLGVSEKMSFKDAPATKDSKPKEQPKQQQQLQQRQLQQHLEEQQQELTPQQQDKKKDQAQLQEEKRLQSVNSVVSQTVQATSKNGKRIHAGMLNFAAATANSKPLNLSATMDNTPDQLHASSIATRATPKTLKIVSTPKIEGPASVPPIAAVRSSAASSARRPETPASSELISDSTSNSATISTSRPGSPPPSKLGSGSVPTRTVTVTKSKVRKQRKEAQKEIVDSIAATPKQESEEIAPIISRKKKQKKSNAPKKAAEATQPSCPQTPAAGPIGEVAHAGDKFPPDTPAKPKVSQSAKSTGANANTNATNGTREAGPTETASSTKDQRPKQESPVQKPASAGASNDNKESKPQLAPVSVFKDLVRRNLVPQDGLAMLKPLPTTNWRHEPLPDGDLAAHKMSCRKIVVTNADLELLMAGKSVRKTVTGVRTLLTGNGDCLRNLTEQEENRFLELQKTVAESNGTPAGFIASRHEPNAGFTLIKGRAVPNGPPSIFPQSPGVSRSDPLIKIQRDETIGYINQYVLPRLGLGNPATAGASESLQDVMKGASTVGTVQRDTAADLQRFLMTSTSLCGHAPVPDEIADCGQQNGDENGRRVGGASSTRAAAGGGSCSGSQNTGHSCLPGAVTPLMSLEDAESTMMLARKETEKLEKSLNQLIKRNRRLLLGSGH